jgi:tetratricopeptide (TPR) repeat protein/tRNA A-37 threonylcarbamoyl transferase component Bud32
VEPERRLGRYVLGRELGRGAMGSVHAAFDPELDRAVAIKLLHVDTERSRASFLREAQAIARLVHRNVVQVHDVGIVRDRLFLAMELVDGPNLRTWLQGDRSRRDVLDVMRQAGAGLLAAHEAGLVHRDFKPENVLLAAAHDAGESLRAVVIDFGLARRSFDSVTDAVRIEPSTVEVPSSLHATQEGAFQGTLAYAAPEQHRGGHCDARSDQFSFCVTLYEALYGCLPFEGETTDALLDAVEAGRVRVPPGGARVAPRLRRAVLRGLAFAPERRFADMRALLGAIAPRRRASPLALALGSAAAIAAAIVVNTGDDESARASYCDRTALRLDGVWDDPTRTAIAAAFAGTGEPSATDALTAVSTGFDAFASAWVATQDEVCRMGEDGRLAADALMLRTGCLDRQLDHARGITEALRIADGAAVLRSSEVVAKLGVPQDCIVDRVLAGRAAARAHVEPSMQQELDELLARAEVLSHTAKYAEAMALAREALGKAQAVDDRWAQAEAWLRVGVAQQWLESASAEQTLHDALSAALTVGHDRVAALAMIGLVELWSVETEGGLARAEQWHQHCLATIEALGGSSALEIELAIGFGNVYLKAGQYDRAQAAYEHALSLRRSPADDVLLGGAYANIGAILAARGDYRDALVQFRRSHAALVGVYGASHPNVGGAAINVGSALAELGDIEAAREAHLEALAVLEQNFGPDHRSLAPALRMLAWNALTRRALDEALPYAERALAIARREGPERSESVARSLSMLGSIHTERRDFEQANALATEALAIASTLYDADHPMRAQFEIDAGVAAIGVHHDDAAREHFARAIASRERTFGGTDLEVGRAWSGVAELELARGRHREAIAAATRAFDVFHHPGNERGGAGPEAAYLLARALVAGGDASDRVRAREIAEDAAADFSAIGPGWQGRADEVSGWLARTRPQ